MSVPLARTLALLGEALQGESEPWWVIGSAAAALHGANVGEVRDVDVLTSASAARRLLARLDAAPEARPSPLFRSEVFGAVRLGSMPVEIMGTLALWERDRWTPIIPVTRERAGAAFVPSRAELAAILRRFGRPKDIARAEALARL